MNFDNLETREPSSGSRKLYTGIAPIQIVTVNPNKKELADLLEIEEDKVKDINYEGEDNYRLDFWYVNHPSCSQPIKGKFSIWVANKTRVSSANKKQYIDSYTKTAWAENLAGLSEAQANLDPERRIDTRSVREAKQGEETLYQMLKAYGNISPKEKPFVLDSFAAICEGRVGELREFISFFNKKDSGLKVLLGIKDSKYQDTFTKMFLNINSKVTDYFKKQVQGEYGFKSYFASYDLKEYTDNVAPDQSEVEASGSTDLWDSDPTMGIDASKPVANPFTTETLDSIF